MTPMFTYIHMSVMLTYVNLLAPRPFPCPDSCVCVITSNGIHANCTGFISYVPTFTKPLSQLLFFGANFSVIDRALLVNISGYHFRKLSFYNTSTVRVETDSFHDITIKQLEICDNKNLDPRNISLDSFVGKRKSILLDGNNFVDIPLPLFRSLKIHRIHLLSLARNLLTSIDIRVFGNMSVEMLDLSNNKLLKIIMGKQSMRDLSLLVLSNNRFGKIPAFCNEKNTPIFPNLTSLHLDRNRIYGHIGENSLFCLGSLSTLRMDNNFIQHINNYSFTNIPHLKHLSLIKLNNFKEVILDSNSFYGLSQLITLKMNSNKIHFDMTTTLELLNMFSNLSNVLKLSLNENRMYHNYRHANVTSILKSMTKLQYLTLVGSEVREISDILFPDTLKHLSLSQNSITHWNNGTKLFGNLKDLKYMSLDVNNINFINESSIPFGLLNNLKSINFANNPMSCTCAQQWFANWLRTTELHVGGPKTAYRCFSPLAYHGTFLKDYDPGFIQCLPFYVIISSTVGVVCICIMLIGGIVYLLRWDIRYWIFKMTTTYVPLENGDFEFNAYVSYEDEDRIFVHDQLCDKIPNICIRLRDFLLAEDIMQNVETHVEASKKVILVLSNNYFNSHWQVAELNYIHSVSVKRRKYICVVIILDDFDKKFLSAICRGFLRDSPCLQWTDNKKGQKLFWRRLEYELSKPAKRYSHI